MLRSPTVRNCRERKSAHASHFWDAELVSTLLLGDLQFDFDAAKGSVLGRSLDGIDECLTASYRDCGRACG